MKITSVNSAVLAGSFSVPQNKNKQNIQAIGVAGINCEPQMSKVDSLVLHQMPNINFSGRYKYGRDDLSPYDNYVGPRPPQIELEKYYLSRQVDNDIANEDYLSAIKGKIELAQICKRQGCNKDSFMLEESIRKLYKDLPKYQRAEAKQAITDYNRDMGKYIDSDISRY